MIRIHEMNNKRIVQKWFIELKKRVLKKWYSRNFKGFYKKWFWINDFNLFIYKKEVSIYFQLMIWFNFIGI